MIFKELISLITADNSLKPLFSSLFLPILSSVSFTLLAFKNSATEVPPSGPSPQFVILSVCIDGVFLMNDSNPGTPDGPKALSLKST